MKCQILMTFMKSKLWEKIKKLIRSSGRDCFLFEYLTLCLRGEKSAGHTSDSWLHQSSISNIIGAQLRSLENLSHHRALLLPSSDVQRRVEHQAGRPFLYSQGRLLSPSCPGSRSWWLRSSGTGPVCSVSLAAGSVCFYWVACCSELLRERGGDRAREEEPWNTNHYQTEPQVQARPGLLCISLVLAEPGCVIIILGRDLPTLATFCFTLSLAGLGWTRLDHPATTEVGEGSAPALYQPSSHTTSTTWRDTEGRDGQTDTLG